MTENQQSDRTDVRVMANHSGDYVLATLVAVAKKSGLELPVTLNVSGQVITGTLIGRDPWFDLLADLGRQAGGAAEIVLDAVRGSVQGLYDADDEEAEEREGRDSHLHLKGARLLAGGHVSGGTSMLWRVRLSEVSGWMVGEMSTS